MIELTSSATLYPLRAPVGPSLRGRRSALSVLLVCMLWRWRLYKSKKVEVSLQLPEAVVPIMNQEIRLQQLLDINTSIRLPEQKAKALLVHLLLYVGIEHNEIDISRYTLEDIKHISGTENFLPFFKILYTIIYTDQKITHSTINNIIKSIHSLITGN